MPTMTRTGVLQAALAREKDRLSKMNQRQVETDEQVASAREKDRLSKSNLCQAETHEQAALARERNKLAKRRKLQPRSEKHSCDMEHVINQLMMESVKFLHQIKDPKNPHKHRATVCIICDHCIIGTEAIHKLMKEQILLHKKGSVLKVMKSIMRKN